MNEEDLFLRVVGLSNDQREEFLRAHGGEDLSLLQRVRERLAIHDAGTFSDGRASEPVPAGESNPSVVRTVAYEAGGKPVSSPDTVGAVIGGRYTLAEVIGEGGMGTVYRAEQTHPVKRSVALKLIKRGMDTRSVLARFDAERQALALMDHPSIARIFDGGLTSAGQPYFVMELVSGTPLTEYCDARRLTINARLELFVQICHAVQHAHQKGIIHRDLKPGNVLVTEVDGRPTPKVIDFGVAKATEQKLTESSFSDVGAIVGTPAYMSPEQADPSTEDIDTRTDVYALGVMLYELLTGLPPIDRSQFKRGAILEMLRMVREVEPPRPSTRLSTTDALPNIAANRNIDPARLSRMLKGELDWVVMKALEKDRNRRYETANNFARDIQRYLADEVVEARPPSRGYRLRKFIRRNRLQVIAASLVFLSLIGGIVGTTLGLVRAEKAREAEARARQQEAIQRGIAEERLQQLRKTYGVVINEVREQLKKAIYTQAVQNDVNATLQRVVLDSAKLEGTTISDRLKMSLLFIETENLRDAGKFEEAKAKLLETLSVADAIRKSETKDFDLAEANYASSLILLGDFQRSRLDLEEAFGTYQEALKIQEAILREPKTREYTREQLKSFVAQSLMNVGIVRMAQNRYDEALQWCGKSLELHEEIVRVDPSPKPRSRLADVLYRISIIRSGKGDSAGAIQAEQRAIEQYREMIKADPDNLLYKLDLCKLVDLLGEQWLQMNQKTEAKKAFDEAVALAQQLAYPPEVINLQRRLASNLYKAGVTSRMNGDEKTATEQLQRCVEIRESVGRWIPPGSPFYLSIRIETMLAYVRVGRDAEAMTIADNLFKLAAKGKKGDLVSAGRLNLSASVYSIAAGNVSRLAKGELTPELQKKRETLVDRSIELLNLAVDIGYPSLRTLETDPDFDDIRADPRFQAVIQRVRDALKK